MSRFVLALTIICASFVYLVHNNRAVLAGQETVSKLPAKLIARHHQYPGCMKLDDPDMPPAGVFFTARLDKQTELYGILCEPAAYNWPYAIYTVRDGVLKDAERLFFADYDRSTGWTGTDLLFNASFNKKTGELSGFSKARGAGDCGSQTILKWDEDLFSLKEFRYKENCDGDIEKPFPLIYKRFLAK
jgi:hypothetical protein